MTQIQNAALAALPQQSRLATSPVKSDSQSQSVGQLITEKLSESQETGDRDAQEQYQRSDRESKNQRGESATTATSPESSVWNLSVADDAPPSDLDIVG
jgi:hypothetical protein